MLFDVTSRNTYKDLPNRYKDLVKDCGTVPTVLCGNNFDSENRKVIEGMIKFNQRYNIPYYDISTKSNYIVEVPFLWLARKLLNDDTLRFVEPPAPEPSEVRSDNVPMNNCEQELAVTIQTRVSG